jgi:lysophospholipase L1-like esterase
MTPVAQKGFDCYVGKSFEDVKFYDSTRFDINHNEYEYTFFDNNKETVYVIVNFPLYAGVEEVLIGIDSQAIITQANPFDDEKRVVVYGTSITQGGCASRPGLNYTNILSRKTKREWINLGFSGNAFGEPELIQVISKIQPVELFIIDYEANSGTNGKLEKTLDAIIKELRENHPKSKIMIISRIPYLFDTLQPELGKRRSEIRKFQQDLVESYNKQGDELVYFVDGSQFFEDNFDEFTIDSIHPNDLGFARIVDGIEKNIRDILK